MPNTPHSLLNYLRTVAGAWREDPRDDAELMARFVDGGDEAAFRVLVCRHGPLVWRACVRVLGDGADSEDAFQVTFLALARKAGRLRREPLAGWLHRVARQTALNTDAEVQRRRSLEHHLLTAARTEKGDASRVELYMALDKELAGLPEQLRVPLVLRYLEGKTLEDVARVVGCSRRVLGDRLTRGEAILRQRLERRGLTVGVVSVGALLGSTVTAPALPVRLIGSTTRAAVAFRSGTLTGRAAEAARAVLGALPSLETTIMRKSLWIMLACCLGLGGTALVTCQTLTARLDEPGEVGSATTQTSGQPGSGGRAAVRIDRQGDLLPTGALARLGTTRLRHGKEVSSVVLSPDGKMVVTGGYDGRVRLWDIATGKEIRTMQGRLGKQVVRLAFASDGKTVAAGEWWSTVRLWETATGKEIRTLPGGSDRDGKPVNQAGWAVAFTSSGKTVATGGKVLTGEKGENLLAVSLRDVSTGKEIRTLKGKAGEGGAVSVAFAPDGKTVAAGGIGGWFRLWETSTGEEIRYLQMKMKNKFGAVNYSIVAFSPDSRMVAVGGGDGWMHLLEVATGKEIYTFEAHKGGVSLLVFSPDGKTVATAASDDGSTTMCLWEAATGKLIQTLQGHKGSVQSMAFASDGKTVVTGGRDGTIRLWDIATGKPLSKEMGHEAPVLGVAFTPDGRTVITGGRDETARLWDAATGKEISILNGRKEEGKIESVVFAPDHKTVATRTRYGWVHLWDTATSKEIRTVKLGIKQVGVVGDSVMCSALAPDSKTLATVEQDGTINLWATTAGEVQVRTLQQKKNDEWIQSLAFSPDSKVLAMGGREGTVRLLKMAASDEETLSRTLQPRQLPKTVRKEGPAVVTSVIFSPDGRIVATGGSVAEGRDGLVRLWETVSGKEICTLQGKGQIVALAFSPDNRTLAATSNECVQLWDLLSGKAFPPLAGHRGNVLDIAFSPDGKALASVSVDTTGLVWDLNSQTARPVTKLDSKTLETLWADLASSDARRAWRAVWTLEANPAQAVPLLRNHLQPVSLDAGKRLLRLVADLEANDFKVRQNAYQELEKLGLDVEPVLRKGLEGNPDVELRKRLKQLLEQVAEQKMGRGLPEEFLRRLRAVRVLESIGTPQAREVLKSVAAGSPGFRLTKEAQTALRRLEETKRR